MRLRKCRVRRKRRLISTLKRLSSPVFIIGEKAITLLLFFIWHGDGAGAVGY